MYDTLVSLIRALLTDTERAHKAYEATLPDGVRDDDWAAWYAHYLTARITQWLRA